MNDDARSAIMARVRGAGGGATAAELARELAGLGQAPAAQPLDQDIAATFLARVLRNQGSIDCVHNRSEAVLAISRYLYSHHQTHKLVAGNDPRLAAMPWRDGGVLPRFDVATDGDKAALSYAQMGIAESGSVVTFTGKGNPSANILLAEDHLVIVDAATLVATFEDAWRQIEQHLVKHGRPRGINLISGPSSTADIVGHMVMGAHGPTRWHVILLGDLPEDLPARAAALAAAAQSAAAETQSDS
jgi:L-lactate dehydrogenase complex protein LldG